VQNFLLAAIPTLEQFHMRRQLDPGLFAGGVNIPLRFDQAGIVDSAGENHGEIRRHLINCRDGRAASGTETAFHRLTAAARMAEMRIPVPGDRDGVFPEYHQGGKGAARMALTIAAMTGTHHQRRFGAMVPYGTA